VHPTLGILARFQAFFYASAFFQSDGVPPPAPARVTQTVGQFSRFSEKQKGVNGFREATTPRRERELVQGNGMAR